MDKLKEFLGVVKRQHFWFLAPILFLIGLFGWLKSSSKLTQEFESNRQAVDAYINQMKNVSNQPQHPNADYIKGMEELIARRSENVLKAWETKWDRQKNSLVWPEGLGKDFIDTVKGLRPIEKVNPTLDINATRRRLYATFIKSELPRLAASVGAAWAPTTSGRTAFNLDSFSGPKRPTEPRGERRGESPSVMSEDELDDGFVVRWNPTNQSEIEEDFSLWGEDLPSTLEVLYAQEDLWVLDDLIGIIKATNGEAVTRSQAAIKEIRFIQIGNKVRPPRDQAFRVVRPAAPGAAEESAAAQGDASEPRDESIATPDAAAEVPADAVAPPPDLAQLRLQKRLQNRYYNDKYEPIADMQSQTGPTVAKRIPVRMRLLIDQRRLYSLLVECANAPMTFEVRQFRFNPQDTGISGPTTSIIGPSMVEENRGNPFAGPMSGTATMLSDYDSYDRVIELFGIIYIFNPVDRALLSGATGTESSDTGTENITP